MKKRILTKISLIVIAVSAICWDLSTSLEKASVPGTYRYEADFDAITGSTATVGIVPSDYEELASPSSRSADITYEQVEDMVSKAIELQGGLKWVVEKGDNVMLKVNLVGGNSPSGEGENTDVRVVKALIKILHEHTEGDVEIVVAEGTARKNDDPNTAGSVWENSGYTDLLTDSYLSGINFSLLNLNQKYSDLVEINIGNKGTAALQGTSYFVHQAEVNADVYIAVPVLKIHDTGITNALKLQVGSAPGCYYGYNKTAGTSYSDGLYHDVGHRRWTTEMIVDLCVVADIDFVVVDALMCLDTYKSYKGNNQVRMNTIIAGADPVAVDHVSTRLFCLNPDDIAHITLAEKIGLGTNRRGNIHIVGASIEDVRKKVTPNSSSNGKFGQSNRSWILSKAFIGESVEDAAIADEANYVPVPGEDEWTQPVYFFDDRIDLDAFYNGQKGIITYAFSYFHAPEAKEAELWLGSDEGIIVYVNGEEVYKSTSTNSFGDDDLGGKKGNINIKEGENTLLVKTLNRFTGYSFTLNICDKISSTTQLGNRVEGLQFYTSEDDYVLKVEEKVQPKQANLQLRAYPVPAQYEANIKFNIGTAANTSILVHDISGRLVANKRLGNLNLGEHTFTWNLTDDSNTRVEKGTYICSVVSGNQKNSIRIIVEE